MLVLFTLSPLSYTPSHFILLTLSYTLSFLILSYTVSYIPNILILSYILFSYSNISYALLHLFIFSGSLSHSLTLLKELLVLFKFKKLKLLLSPTIGFNSWMIDDDHRWWMIDDRWWMIHRLSIISHPSSIFDHRSSKS